MQVEQWGKAKHDWNVDYTKAAKNPQKPHNNLVLVTLIHQVQGVFK